MIGLRTKTDQLVEEQPGTSAGQELSSRPQKQPNTRRQDRSLLAFILAAFAAIALVYSVTVPLWEAPDESEHIQYIVYLVEQHRLPDHDLPTIQPDGNNEGKQPPLYYLLALPFVQGIDVSDAVRIRSNFSAGAFDQPDALSAAVHVLDEYWPWHGVFLAAHLVRLYSVLLGTINVLLVYGVAVTCTGRRTTGLVAASLVAFLPGYLFGTSTIDNDVLGYTLSSALLLVAVRATRSNVGSYAWLFGVLGACALLSKLTVVPTMALGALAVVLVAPPARRLSIICRLAAPSAIPAVYWVWRVSTGDQRLIGRPVHFPTAVFNPAAWNFHELPIFWQHFSATFFGEFSWEALLMPSWVYGLYEFIFGAGLLLVVLVFRQPSSGRPPLASAWLLIILPLVQLTGMLTATAIVSEGAMGYDHARLIYPALAAIITVIAYGWTAHAAVVARLRPLAPLILSLGAALAVLVAVFTIRPAYGAPWRISDTVPAAATVVQQGAFAHDVTLAAEQLPTTAVNAGQPVSIWLYWRVNYALPAGEVLTLQLVNPQGTAIASFEGPPSNRLPPDMWRPGDVVYDREVLPTITAAPSGDYSLVLSWHNVETGVPIVLAGGGTRLTAGTIHVNAQG